MRYLLILLLCCFHSGCSMSDDEDQAKSVASYDCEISTTDIAIKLIKKERRSKVFRVRCKNTGEYEYKCVCVEWPDCYQELCKRVKVISDVRKNE